MPKKIFLSNVGGEPSGFIFAAICAAVALFAVVVVAIDLPNLKSFREIAAPSAFALVFGFLGACAAVLTSHALDGDDEGPHTQL